MPVLRYIEQRNLRGQFLPGPGTRTNEIMPLHEITLLNTGAHTEFPSAPRLRALALARDREHHPLSREEKWQMMLLAFSRYVQSERESIDAEYDEDGNVILVKASDWHIAVDPAAFARAQEGDSQGFLLQEMRGRREPGIGMTPMEVLIHRPLGNINPMPLQMWNKSGLYPLAFEDLKGECMSRQLQISMVVRERKNGCDEMVHQFELSEITKYGGLLDQACIRLAKGETETTYRALTPAKEKIIDDFTPMANAVEKLLKKLKEAQPMDKVNTYIDNKMKDTTDLKQFKDIRNDHFKKKNVKVRDRNEAFLKLFRNKFHLDMNKVGIAKDPPPLPHPEGLAFPYETKGWRDIGITAELAAEVCVLSGHPCLVMHNTTLIYQRYPEGWTYEKGKPMVCFNVWGDH